MASNRMPTEKHFEYLGLLQLTEVNVELPMWHNLKKKTSKRWQQAGMVTGDVEKCSRTVTRVLMPCPVRENHYNSSSSFMQVSDNGFETRKDATGIQGPGKTAEPRAKRGPDPTTPTAKKIEKYGHVLQHFSVCL